MVRIMIADDHQMLIDGITSLLADQSDIQIIGQAHNGQELLDLMKTTLPDVVLMDINMPEMDGIEATRIIRETYPDVRVLMLTMHDGADFITNVLEKGASGYILKNTGKKELIRAIGTLAQGGTYFGMQVSATLMKHLQQKANNPEKPVSLSTRETQILQLICAEHTTAEIAAQLGIGIHTVETYRKNLLHKLKARNIAGLVRYAMNVGLISE